MILGNILNCTEIVVLIELKKILEINKSEDILSSQLFNVILHYHIINRYDTEFTRYSQSNT